VSPIYATLGVVTLQRLVELAWSMRNTSRLRRVGAIEIDAAGYPWFILLHAGWLASLAALVPAQRLPYWPLVALYALLQPLRLWVILSLGRFWTTRILTLAGVRLVRSGPYRWLRHPNYLIALAEIALLPLAFGAVIVAAGCSAVNLVLVIRRIVIEERALATRRAL
jgi:methyltransferase